MISKRKAERLEEGFEGTLDYSLAFDMMDPSSMCQALDLSGNNGGMSVFKLASHLPATSVITDLV